MRGWVRNTWEGTVEAVFEGAPEAVERLVAFAHGGPSSARVERVEVFVEEDEEGLTGFADPLREPARPGGCTSRERSDRMKRILIAAVLVGALVQAGAASAGCMATVGLAPPPAGIAAGTTWTAELTVLQHGRNALPNAATARPSSPS